MPTKRVLSIGQCCADHGSISRALTKHFGAEVVAADTEEEAIAHLRQGGFDLVLLNRIFDANGSSGLEVLKRLKSEESVRNVPVMLVTNYEQVQQQASELGAVPGFGKAALTQPATIERLKAYLG